MVPSIKMSKLDIVLTIIFAVLVVTCLVLEFVPVLSWIKALIGGITGVYALACMIFFRFEY